MSVVMLVMSVQVYGQSENNGYGENYQTHSGVSLYEEIDYQKLQADLQDFCIEQEKNGCTVTELTITYIMPEAIEQWLAGKEQEQFFGVSLSELEKEAGENTSFYFDENGLQSFNPEAEYNCRMRNYFDWRNSDSTYWWVCYMCACSYGENRHYGGWIEWSNDIGN